MNKIYILLILVSAAFAAKAQPTQPGTPVTCSATNCTTNSNIDVCPPGNNTVVSNTQNGVYSSGNNGHHLQTGAIWRFRNIATVSGVTVNMEVKINAISNAVLDNLDDDDAVDQANNSIASFFAPRIGPDQNLNGTDRRGYVEFQMSFFKNASGSNSGNNNDFAVSVSLANLNYVHYDIDGNDADNVAHGGAGSWYRETGLAKRISATNPIVLANSPTDLVSYVYTDPSTTTWTGFAGSTCERDGVSRCAQIASSFSYGGPQASITFRMGYDYNAGGNIGAPIRQYGSRLGCFNFPSQATLPVKLLSFSGSFRNNSANLNWEAADEENFDHYEIQRSTDPSSFSSIANKAAVGTTISTQSYQYSDDLSNQSGSTFYYRLKIVDRDGQFKYSNVIVIKKDAKSINGISMSPIPVVNSMATVRFTVETGGMVDVKVMEMSGKIVLQQQDKVFPGNNSISVNNLDRLQPGTYILQMANGGEVSVVKFTVAR